MSDISDADPTTEGQQHYYIQHFRHIKLPPPPPPDQTPENSNLSDLLDTTLPPAFHCRINTGMPD
eukprot:4651219-Lingulodinium_polyedra.AAC.1